MLDEAFVHAERPQKCLQVEKYTLSQCLPPARFVTRFSLAGWLGGDSIALFCAEKGTEKWTEKPICYKHMKALVFLGGTSVCNFQKWLEKWTEKWTEKWNEKS